MAERKSKADTVSAIAATTGLAKNVVAEVLDNAIDTIQEWVVAGQEVVFVGFGTFATATRSARTGRNPQTGATITIEASKSPKFKPGKAFKDKVNGKDKKK